MALFRMDNVLQQVPQTLIKLLIILISMSSTAVPLVRGVEAVYDGHAENGGWLYIVIFYTSFLMSMMSIPGLLVSVQSFSKFGLAGNSSLLRRLYTLGSLARVSAFVLLAAPYLGLFGLMKPYVTVRSLVLYLCRP